MSETFITHIQVDKVRHLLDFAIPLSATERQHLIVTGKNGSGKTSLLLALRQNLTQVHNGNYRHLAIWNQAITTFSEQLEQNTRGTNDPQISVSLQSKTRDIENQLNQFGGIKLVFSDSVNVLTKVQSNSFLMTYFGAKRQNNLQVPSGIKALTFSEKPGLDRSVGQEFIQYIVNLKAERSFAKDDGDEETATKIHDWFSRFEARLGDLFGSQDVELIFDRKQYNFSIKLDGREAFNLTELSDGYSAVMSIITEILLRMESVNNRAYDLEGIVIIDEIETHLHVDLQKKILPFLCDFFPKIQFIVSTHSPFVLSSVQNAVICDLESRIVTQDLSGYSYDALIESYFGTDKYSENLKQKVARYEELADLPTRTEQETDEYQDLKQYLSSLPKYLAPELAVKLQQIQLKHLS
jgi:predicted ATP-binding protein involved in virulence